MVLTTYNIVGKEVVLDDGDKSGEKPVTDDDDDKKDQEGEVC